VKFLAVIAIIFSLIAIGISGYSTTISGPQGPMGLTGPQGPEGSQGPPGEGDGHSLDAADGNPTDVIYVNDDGYVGLGVLTPNSMLEVAGVVHSTSGGFKFPDGTIQTTAVISSGGGGNTLDQAYDEGGSGAGRRITAEAGAVNITGPDGLLVDGKVGIGTFTPGAILEVHSDTTYAFGITPIIRISDNFKFWNIGLGSESGGTRNDRFSIASEDYTERFVIDKTNGNVGIGTTNPTSKLHVIGKGTFTGGVDPPYISFSSESHESIRQYAKSVEEHEIVMQFWNGEAHRMEIYVISEDAFYTILGELILE
jgi:hypothetical protein